jgi:hypothetical protein
MSDRNLFPTPTRVDPTESVSANNNTEELL